jgi:hypothetical protein
MSNIRIFMRIIKAFLSNLEIIYACCDYKNDCYAYSLILGGCVELIDANIQQLDLLYPLRLSLRVDFFSIDIFYTELNV